MCTPAEQETSISNEQAKTPAFLMNCDTLQPKDKGPRNLLQKSIEEYYYDKIEDETEVYKKFYEKIYYAPSTEFEEARHKVACLDNLLVQARYDWKEENKIIQARWAEAKHKQISVEESIPRFNNYYLDSLAKRDRAQLQEQKERQQIQSKEREIRRLEKEREVLTDVRDQMESRLDKFSIFKVYLERVKEASQGEYGDLREIIDRYAVLAEARSSLMSRNDNCRTTIQRRLKALDNDIVMKANEVLAYRNFLSELMDYQMTLQDQVLRLEDSLLRIKTTAARRTLVIGQIKMSIRNLYLSVCRQMRRHAKIPPEDTLGQLADIRISVGEMRKLGRDIKHMLKAASVAAGIEAKARERARIKAEERGRKLARLNKGAMSNPREVFGLPPRKSHNKVKFDPLKLNKPH